MPHFSYRGINRNLLFTLGCTILLLAGGTGYLLLLNSTSNTKPLDPAGVAHAAPISQPNRPHITAETIPQNSLVSGVVAQGTAATTIADNSNKTQLIPVALPVDGAHRVRQAQHEFRQTRDEQPTPQPYKSSTISIGQQQAEPVDSLLRDAYLAYQNGKLDEAQQLYLAIFRENARNPDVLLGLAAIAQQHGENLLAAKYFSQVLALDPRNAVANAGVSALSADDDNSESRLKTLLREQGNSAALHFALGNIYADQSRWGEAQQAYFNAYTLESGNAGFSFNLAVSLDHLGQNKLAVQHYQRAMELNQTHSAGFDHMQISQRIEELARYGNADKPFVAP